MKATTLIMLSSLAPCFVSASNLSAQQCPQDGVYLQVLGAGGPELTTGNVSTSYLLWDEGKAVVLLDAGSGTAAHFNQTGAKVSDLSAILISHMHVDHVADLISLIKSSYFEQRDSSLPIYGPTGNHLTPGMSDYMTRLLGIDGLYPYLNNFIAQAPDQSYSKSSYRLIPHDIAPSDKVVPFSIDNIGLKTASAEHGSVPALSWSIAYKGKEVFITGDSSGPAYLKDMADSADLVIAHNALPQSYSGPVEKLHMKPEKIGQIMADSKAHTLVLSHFLLQTSKAEEQTMTAQELRKNFDGQIRFANDFDCYAL